MLPIGATLDMCRRPVASRHAQQSLTKLSAQPVSSREKPSVPFFALAREMLSSCDQTYHTTATIVYKLAVAKLKLTIK